MRSRVLVVLLVPVLFIATWASPARGDFESASAAYRNQNYTQAFHEFRKLAGSGDPRAQSVLAIMYKYGEGVPLDVSAAFDWYMLAAEQGYPPALFNVGEMLADGKGVERNEEAALTWLARASQAGYERANDKIAELKGKTTIAIGARETIAWSKSWNLRLPNEIRYEDDLQVSLKPETIPMYRIQLGAMGTVTAAEHLWHLLSAGNEDLFEGYQPIFREGQSADTIIYRLQLGPFDARPDAVGFCNRLKTRLDNGCLVVAPD